MNRAPLALLPLLVGCLPVLVGDGVSVSEDRPFVPYESVVNLSPFAVDVTLGVDPYLQVTCDGNLLDAIRTDIDDGELAIRVDAGVILDPGTDCGVAIGVPALARVTNAASGPLTVAGQAEHTVSEVTNTGSGGIQVFEGLVTDTLDVTNTGSSAVDLADVEATSLTLFNSGSGGIAVHSGFADALTLTDTASAIVDLRDVWVREGQVTLTGSGAGHVRVTDALTARLSGSGDLYLYVEPDVIEARTTGSGDIILVPGN